MSGGLEVVVCPPDYFFEQIEPATATNARMHPGERVDLELTRQQWLHLVNTMEEIGIDVAQIEPHPNLPDMVFATDSALVIDNIAVMARFRHSHRQPESDAFRDWMVVNGYKVIDLPDDGEHYFEGGDAQVYEGNILLGTGYRSTRASAGIIQRGLDVPVITLELERGDYYHLDTAMCVAGDLMFYHPPAFSEASLEVIWALVPPEKLIEFDPAEAGNFAANSLVFGNHVILQSGNPIFEAELTRRGFTTHVVNLSEFQKAGGGAHCAVQQYEANAELATSA